MFNWADQLLTAIARPVKLRQLKENKIGRIYLTPTLSLERRGGINFMLEIIIITISKIKNEFFAGAIEEYLKRLKPYAAVKIIELASESFGNSDKEKAKQAEGERILRALEKYSGAEIFLLHERGEEIDSVKFARRLESSVGKTVFVIAGALGFAEEVLQKYRQLSLSKMTFPHEMARLILLEQIYRSATIIQGKIYHY
jgi:23S rRNA (pseudouridine1915-N3)-methyltransferase